MSQLVCLHDLNLENIIKMNIFIKNGASVGFEPTNLDKMIFNEVIALTARPRCSTEY